jgi:PLP dependent protein
VEARIRDAAERAGRRREDITLIAVTKKFPARVIREAWALGVRHFGRITSRSSRTKRRRSRISRAPRFHLIGHLQSNKARKAADLFQSIQTVDSVKLARRLEQMGNALDVMIEVKLSEEESKSGADPAGLSELVDALRGSSLLRLRGLMTMPPWSDDPEQTRPYFRRLKQLADQHGIGGLSMGMSHDLEAAIEEGATHVRIGTALFGPRRKE